ncbi:hypothetical protein EVAR_8402_1 [Eumeta japonica]|uniref:Uncharacterized protein n=1 Tax=Eumeta variegata TaxID=151549 RepID=A0A4C1WF44_EUMVA|nr:hypothetical protein EVAR_8402_1 [Eumeta japonica]
MCVNVAVATFYHVELTARRDALFTAGRSRRCGPARARGGRGAGARTVMALKSNKWRCKSYDNCYIRSPPGGGHAGARRRPARGTAPSVVDT